MNHDKPHPMTTLLAIETVENRPNDARSVEAWQYLLDTGTVWKLQGWYGRTAVDMLMRGLLTQPMGGTCQSPARGP